MTGPSDASRSVYVTFQNFTNNTLSRTSESLDHGIWSTDLYPQQTINPGTPQQPTSINFAAESQGFMTGVEGRATYLLPDGKTTVELYLNNPYSGSNGYKITVNGPESGHFNGSYNGGGGDNANITYTLKSN
ncbi:hypothetical protein K461DRAFT_296198 [Myriangium duriaei CBS 260.36]|uniref:Uncharacterized protein n=1 Tax=Myriangium duriaei CBS 260.36 TaxID=1168546 RepID=A0A9P4ME27_9PEZI|nr:hypothetical protein K461DRAFT_296198 [Myriangium duriaei CBS 260.36]